MLRKLGIRVHTARSLEKRHRRRITRVQFNFACSPDLAAATKIMAQELEVPTYLLLEHLIQTGARVLAPCLNDPALKATLQVHLVRDHLKVYGLDPRREPEYPAPPEEGAEDLAALMKQLKDLGIELKAKVDQEADGEGNGGAET